MGHNIARDISYFINKNRSIVTIDSVNNFVSNSIMEYTKSKTVHTLGNEVIDYIKNNIIAYKTKNNEEEVKKIISYYDLISFIADDCSFNNIVKISKKNRKTILKNLITESVFCRCELENLSEKEVLGENENLCDEITFSKSFESSHPLSYNEIMSMSGLDESKWICSEIKHNQWDALGKDNQKVILYQTKATFVRKSVYNFDGLINDDYSRKISFTKYLHCKNKNVMIVPDMQIGYKKVNGKYVALHDEEAINVMIKSIATIFPSRIVLLGDNLDFAEFGKYVVTDEYKNSLAMSIKTLYGILKEICKEVVKTGIECEIDYIEGNHEYRLQRYLSNLSPITQIKDVITDETYFSIPKILHLDELGISYHSDWPNGRVKIADNLVCVHGEVAKSRSGATASSVACSSDYNVIMGHTHRYEVASRTVMTQDGEPRTIQCISMGCLCSRKIGLVPGKISEQNWQVGFGVIHVTENENYYTHNFYPIDNGFCVIDGVKVENS